MGKIKTMLMVKEEERYDLYQDLAALETELAFLEHEEYSLRVRLASIKEKVEDKKLEIEHHENEMLKNFN